MARIEAVLRYIEPQGKRKTLDFFVHGNGNIDFKQPVVTIAGEEKYLNAGRFMICEELLSCVWGSEPQGEG